MEISPTAEEERISLLKPNDIVNLLKKADLVQKALLIQTCAVILQWSVYTCRNNLSSDQLIWFANISWLEPFNPTEYIEDIRQTNAIMSSVDDTDYVHLFISKIRSTCSIALVFYFPQLSDILVIYVPSFATLVYLCLLWKRNREIFVYWYTHIQY